MKRERFQTFFKAQEVQDLSTTLNSVRAKCLQLYPRNNHKITAEFEDKAERDLIKERGVIMLNVYLISHNEDFH